MDLPITEIYIVWHIKIIKLQNKKLQSMAYSSESKISLFEATTPNKHI